MTEQNSAAWLLLAFGEQRSYAGNMGYADELEAEYKYDSFVQNHKRIREGDLAVLRDKVSLVGFARIARIVETEGTKIRQYCPRCNSSVLSMRRVKQPPLYCTSCKHEFTDAIQREADCTTFTAYFDGSFVSARGALSLPDLRKACPNYNAQLAMQPISEDALAEALELTYASLQHILSVYEPEHSLGPHEGENAPFVPDAADERERILQAIRQRRGKRSFRNAMRARYGDRCVVTGCTLVDVLEAAHISPYRGAGDNHPANGLLLRADIHTLFDLDLLAIEPCTFRVQVHPDARAAYPGLHDSALTFPGDHVPSEAALRKRWERFLASGKRND